jgi:hypothetical protein
MFDDVFDNVCDDVIKTFYNVRECPFLKGSTRLQTKGRFKARIEFGFRGENML